MDAEMRDSTGDNLSMVATVDKPAAVLVVTGPARDRLCELFRHLYAGRGDVCVVAERRVAERRGSGVRAPVERRRGERRVSAPWFVFPPR
jgi:hypothetical protein